MCSCLERLFVTERSCRLGAAGFFGGGLLSLFIGLGEEELGFFIASALMLRAWLILARAANRRASADKLPATA